MMLMFSPRREHRLSLAACRVKQSVDPGGAGSIHIRPAMPLDGPLAGMRDQVVSGYSLPCRRRNAAKMRSRKAGSMRAVVCTENTQSGSPRGMQHERAEKAHPVFDGIANQMDQNLGQRSESPITAAEGRS